VSGPLAGRRALVVGGTSGIGLGAATRLARDGARVTLCGRDRARAEAAVAGLRADGLAAGPAVADANDPAAVAAAVDEASDGDGRLDIAVVVPGRGAIGPVLLADDAEFADQVGRNVLPVFHTLKYAGRAMVRNGGGSFVAVSSTAARFSARYLASYGAGKAAVDQLVRVAADELGAHGVRVNAVQPGLTRTAATEAAFRDEAMVEAFLDGQPLRRPGEVADVAEAIRFFAGPESSWVTGQVLAVDGGHTLRAFVDYAELVPLPDVLAAALDWSAPGDRRDTTREVAP
jgi:NAD(P)-dependent dehydrogenase (short-subunit alcohol dehydrogenase family)